MSAVTLRPYAPADAPHLAALYFRTVHTVCAGDYSPEELDAWASAPVFITHASITAKGFFLKRGYEVVRAQQVERRGVLLTNFVMHKRRIAQAGGSPC